MWAAMSLSVAAPAPFATTKPAANRLSAGAPRKFQLYSQRRNLDLAYAAEQKQQIRKKSQTNHLGYRAEQKQKFWKKSQTTHIHQAEEEQVEEKQVDSKDEEKKLTGFDVLQALEKATARKMKKKRNGRDGSLLTSRKVSEQTAAEDEATADYGNKIVRALSIREDWGTRLDQLEKRLVQLVDTIA
ncbi:uncharacterized protein LOC125810144 [Solanum verrucosum]|uniref:uncharacterized protein LOC125810144 n=1 Tax=Solanum verrucosum TaxID=315347 RepID=UPI0020D1BDF1|nr:uncharacterized protein LOC125810144 [Solanum verrucosum]